MKKHKKFKRFYVSKDLHKFVKVKSAEEELSINSFLEKRLLKKKRSKQMEDDFGF